MAEQSEWKDALAWTIIYGGSTVAKIAALAVAVSIGIITQKQSQLLSYSLGRSLDGSRNKAWETYKSTGNLSEALGEFFS